MNIVENFFNSSSDVPNCICIGNFDGVHLGHQALIEKLLSQANSKKIASCVFTFCPHPAEFFQQKKMPLIMPLSTRVKHLQKLGVNSVRVIDFSHDFASLRFEDFLELLIERYQLQQLVVGENTHLGFAQKGSPFKIKAFLNKRGIQTDIVALKPIQGKIISSSLIRNLIQNGDLVQVNKMLGYHYYLDGTVVRGRGQGEQIGFATANMIPDHALCLPKPGVYKTHVQYEDSIYSAVSNFGVSPTMHDNDQKVLETHILNFPHERLYGKTLKVQFLKWLRPEKKFASVEELKQQIEKDILLCS